MKSPPKKRKAQPPMYYNYYDRTKMECIKCNFSDECRKETSEFTLEPLYRKMSDNKTPEITKEEAKTIIEALADKYDLDLIVYEK